MHIRRPLCVFCLFFVFFLAGITGALRIRGSSEDDPYEGRELRFKGTIKQIESKNDKLILHIKDICLSDGTDLTGKILVYIPYQEKIRKQLHIGAVTEAKGKFSRFEPAYNRGQFDLRAYYELKGYAYVIYDAKLYTVSLSYDRISDSLYRISVRTKEVYEHYFGEEDSGVINALVLADKSGLDKSLKRQYQDAGIAHILALSGLHIATLGLLVLKLLRKTGLPVLLSTVISTALILSYCIMIGMPVSAVRALIMYVLSITATLFGRTADLKTSAAAACLIMLVVNPDRLYDASFLMSFSSVMGIGLVYPYIRELVYNVFDETKIRRLKRSGNLSVRLSMGILTSLLLSLSIQLAILPFSIWFYYRIPIYGILVNLIVVPLAGILLVLVLVIGLLGNVVFCLAGFGGLLDGAVKVLSYPVHLILGLYDLITDGADSLPGAVLVTGRPKAWQMMIYFTVLVLILTGSVILEHRKKVMTGRLRKRYDPGCTVREMKRYLKLRSTVVLSLCIPALIILFVNIRPRFEMSALYVGQGQCFVMHGRDIPTVMYDCGSSDEKSIGEYIVGPFLEYSGISRVDTAFVSHMDIDHVGGLIQLLEDEHSHVSIGRIVISSDPGQEKSENYASLMKAADLRDVPVYKMGGGDVIKWSRLSVEAISPRKDHEGYEDTNDGSLVLMLAYEGRRDDFTALFTGDIGSDVEDELVSNWKKEGLTGTKCDCLQAAHHGSRHSANEDFLSFVSPRIAVISAGINNKYGHPHEETLKLFENLNIPVFVTSEEGEVTFRY